MGDVRISVCLCVKIWEARGGRRSKGVKSLADDLCSSIERSFLSE